MQAPEVAPAVGTAIWSTVAPFPVHSGTQIRSQPRCEARFRVLCPERGHCWTAARAICGHRCGFGVVFLGRSLGSGGWSAKRSSGGPVVPALRTLLSRRCPLSARTSDHLGVTIPGADAPDSAVGRVKVGGGGERVRLAPGPDIYRGRRLSSSPVAASVTASLSRLLRRWSPPSPLDDPLACGPTWPLDQAKGIRS